MTAAGSGAPSASISSRRNSAVGALPITTTEPASRSRQSSSAAAERVVRRSAASSGTAGSDERADDLVVRRQPRPGDAGGDHHRVAQDGRAGAQGRARRPRRSPGTRRRRRRGRPSRRRGSCAPRRATASGRTRRGRPPPGSSRTSGGRSPRRRAGSRYSISPIRATILAGARAAAALAGDPVLARRRPARRTRARAAAAARASPRARAGSARRRRTPTGPPSPEAGSRTSPSALQLVLDAPGPPRARDRSASPCGRSRGAAARPIDASTAASNWPSGTSAVSATRPSRWSRRPGASVGGGRRRAAVELGARGAGPPRPDRRAAPRSATPPCARRGRRGPRRQPPLRDRRRSPRPPARRARAGRCRRATAMRATSACWLERHAAAVVDGEQEAAGQLRELDVGAERAIERRDDRIGRGHGVRMAAGDRARDDVADAVVQRRRQEPGAGEQLRERTRRPRGRPRICRLAREVRSTSPLPSAAARASASTCARESRPPGTRTRARWPSCASCSSRLPGQRSWARSRSACITRGPWVACRRLRARAPGRAAAARSSPAAPAARTPARSSARARACMPTEATRKLHSVVAGKSAGDLLRPPAARARPRPRSPGTRGRRRGWRCARPSRRDDGDAQPRRGDGGQDRDRDHGRVQRRALADRVVERRRRAGWPGT